MSCTSDIFYRFYLQFFVGRRHVLFTLFVFASYSGVQHILCCILCNVCLRLMYGGVRHILCCVFCFVCLRLVACEWWYPPHIVLCFLFCLSSLYVLCTQCCQFLCIVHCPLGLSNVCIHSAHLRLITILPSNILRIVIEISYENHHDGCNSSNFKVDELS